jgi:uncharacterized protein (DUF433 family)
MEAVDKTLISRDPEIMGGAMVFSGTRVPIKTLFDYLKGGESLAEFLDDFPTVEKAHAISVLETAHSMLDCHE